MLLQHEITSLKFVEHHMNHASVIDTLRSETVFSLNEGRVTFVVQTTIWINSAKEPESLHMFCLEV